MVVPVTGTIPDSTLSPAQVRAKFSSHSLAGLGDAWCLSGDCTVPIMGVDPDTGDPIQTGCGGCPSGDTSGTGSYDSSYSGTFSSAGIGSGGSGVSVVSSSVDASGNVYMALSNGKYVYVSPSGQVLAGNGSPTGVGGTITNAQAQIWGSLITNLTKAGVQLGTVAMLQPGQSLLPNGTIAGSGQQVISGGTSINLASLTSLFTSPVFLIGGFGLIALLALSGRR